MPFVIDKFKSKNGALVSEEDRLSNESIVISSSNYKNKDNSTSMTQAGKIRKWNRSHTLIFLHIAKCGGTSFDATMPEICKI